MVGSPFTQEQVKEWFEYRSGGALHWRKGRKKAQKGNRYGSKRTDGYRRGWLLGKQYFEHRLIWFYHYGEWPKDDLDHINGIRDDNKIENLREVTKQQNQFNRKSNRGSSSGYKGVCYHKNINKWMAYFCSGSKRTHIGYFGTEIEAAKAYDNAVKSLHGKYAKLNITEN